jgi:hypothetical protein
MNITRTLKLSAVLLAVMVLTMAIYGFAAANTFAAPTNAGDGAEDISGYAISSIHYNLNYATPVTINTVTFTATPAPTGTIKIKLVDAGNTWYDCTNVGTAVTCGTALAPLGLTVTTADKLRVVISD